MLLWSFEGERPLWQAQPASPEHLTIWAVIAAGKHLFPFRTEKLSPLAPMVLGEQSPGRVGRRPFLQGPARGPVLFRPLGASRARRDRARAAAGRVRRVADASGRVRRFPPRRTDRSHRGARLRGSPGRKRAPSTARA